MARVLVAGLGLIGGSLALNLTSHTNHTLLGYDHDQKTLQYAKEKGLVHETTPCLKRPFKRPMWSFYRVLYPSRVN
ncbi:hypothetical protein [Halolactibacillus sp. JCM 19043]|uniref:hypothetical protein n=1 Tax=Halolactibacillus sp. JCM 19043 TaxID=1460638 RepID=UPI00351134E6